MKLAQVRGRVRARWIRRHPLTLLGPSLLLLTALPAHAQAGGGADPWDNAVNVLKTAFTGTIATGLSLVAIVVGGLMFAYGEGQSKKMLPYQDLPGEPQHRSQALCGDIPVQRHGAGTAGVARPQA
jgi:type IV secretory pathway VirB2 component (pilin)